MSERPIDTVQAEPQRHAIGRSRHGGHGSFSPSSIEIAPARNKAQVSVVAPWTKRQTRVVLYWQLLLMDAQ
jgi:hypothetical protein